MKTIEYPIKELVRFEMDENKIWWLRYNENHECFPNKFKEGKNKYGDIERSVYEYQQRYPHAHYNEIEQQCYPGIDGKYDFTCISPRVMEAALAETVQLAVPGNYSGILKPMEDYIPLKIDCSNIDEVYTIMKDKETVTRITKNCKSAILNKPELRAKVHVKKTIKIIRNSIHGN